MIHIRKKDSRKEEGWAYTLVITDGYGGEGEPPLEQHPCIVNEPDVFELVDDTLPDVYQIMIYVEQTNM